MTERIRRSRPVTRSVDTGTETEVTPVRDVSGDVAALDAILDEIDAVLATDAEDYVKGFVQKGGQ